MSRILFDVAVNRAPDPEEVTLSSSCEAARRAATVPTTRSDMSAERDAKFEVIIVNSFGMWIRDFQ